MHVSAANVPYEANTMSTKTFSYHTPQTHNTHTLDIGSLVADDEAKRKHNLNPTNTQMLLTCDKLRGRQSKPSKTTRTHTYITYSSRSSRVADEATQTPRQDLA